MPRFKFFVFSNCTDPAREQEYNRWYTHTHLPDLSHAKGFVGASRYVNIDPKSTARYLALYEFETDEMTDDIDACIASLYQLAAESWPKRRHIDCIAPGKVPSTVVGFREIDPASLQPLETHEMAHYPDEMPEAVLKGFANA